MHGEFPGSAASSNLFSAMWKMNIKLDAEMASRTVQGIRLPFEVVCMFAGTRRLSRTWT